jgi:asparagine synthase (glutamine-hydrolysing)
MCGFVGILHFDGRPVEHPMLAQMARAIAHRGPDGEGSFVDGPVGFHHKRLAIIDLHNGQQPMTRDGVTVVLNGEIYNYVELREGLAARGHRFDTSSDTEVLLRMYLEHGEGCVRQLNGMFAFLIYDARTGQVLAARDHFGIKPLYCYQTRELTLFGSEIKAILQHPAVRAEVDLDGLREYVTFQFVLGEGTLFRGVRKLLPGHYQIFDVATGRSRKVKYWEPRFEIDSHHNEAYFASTLRSILEDAIRLQLRSDVPVGAHLSGGMDSTLVTALAASRYPGRLKTFTGRFLEGPEFDESRYAKEAASASGAEWFDTVCTADEFVELLPTLVYHMDEPAAGPGLFPQYVVSRRAAEHVKVVLGGQGGDEIFGGYARYLVAYMEQAL